MVEQLIALGLADHPAVLVHSSFKGLGSADPGLTPTAVVEHLVAAAGPDTTVLFPTLTYSADHGPDNPPHTDLRQAPALTGAIPEAGRVAAGTQRSLHPTHSVAAVGGEPERWIGGHDRVPTPCGAGSPYDRLVRQGGAILLLGGVTNDSNTTLHCLEEWAEVPYHLQPEVSQTSVIAPDGTRVEVPNRLHLWGYDRWFTRADQDLVEAGLCRQGQVGAGTAVLIDAAGLADLLLPRMTEDPLYLLTPQARAQFEADQA